MGNGKNKGSNFERLISKKLSKWWTDGKRDDVFWRSQSSGGWNTIRRIAGQLTSTQYGDIQAIDSIGKPLLEALCIEVKIGYGKWSVLDCIDKPAKGAEQVFESFLKQVLNDWKSINNNCSYPCLIAKRNMRKPIIFIPYPLYSKIRSVYGIKYFDSKKSFLMCIKSYLYEEMIIAMAFDDFLQWCRAQFFKDRMWKNKPDIAPYKPKDSEQKIKKEEPVTNNKISRRTLFSTKENE